MWDEVYIWLESYSGITYNFRDSLRLIQGQKAFIDPFDWRNTLEMILSQLSDAIDIVDEYGDNLPDTLPTKPELKENITTSVLGDILSNISAVEKQLGISSNDINGYNQMLSHITALADLIDLCIDHDLEDILKNNLFEKYNDENDNAFTAQLDIYRADMSNISYVINTIRSDYSELLDVDNE